MNILTWLVLLVNGGVAVFLGLQVSAWARTFKPAEWVIFGVGMGTTVLSALYAGINLLA